MEREALRRDRGTRGASASASARGCCRARWAAGVGVPARGVAVARTGRQDESKRLVLAFYAMDNGAGIYVAFGKKMGEIPVTVAAPEKK